MLGDAVGIRLGTLVGSSLGIEEERLA